MKVKYLTSQDYTSPREFEQAINFFIKDEDIVDIKISSGATFTEVIVMYRDTELNNATEQESDGPTAPKINWPKTHPNYRRKSI